MKLVEQVYKISEDFIKNARFIEINYKKIEELANNMLQEGSLIFPSPVIENVYKGIIVELVAASINYCYWYGCSDIRPCNANSGKMYNDVTDSFYEYIQHPYEDNEQFNQSIDELKKILCLHRYPLIEERCKHLDELKDKAEEFCLDVENNNQEINPLMNTLVSLFPGFASDIFLKRASLFFIQLYRRFRWFEKDMNHIHVPSDYQIPKMLNHFGCIKYTYDLNSKIISHQLIPKHSLEECEIRSATIYIIRELCKLTKWNIAEVDGWLFLKREVVAKPFHLTVTTDY